MKKKTVICDAESGVCELQYTPQTKPRPKIHVSKDKPLRIIYYTDPICSACWAVEGVLHRLELEYGHIFSMDMHMGGLMPSWDKSDTEQAKEMARMVDEAGQKYGVPVNGSVWLTNPLSSSFSPSIACKAAELQSLDQSYALLRRLRESFFVEGRDISNDQVILETAAQVGLNVDQLVQDIPQKGKELFDQDIELGIGLGVWGFPTLYFFGANGEEQELFGVYPYEKYEQVIKELVPAAEKRKYDQSVVSLMNRFGSLTVKELAILGGCNAEEALRQLNEIEKNENIEIVSSPNGSVWRLKNNSANFKIGGGI